MASHGDCARITPAQLEQLLGGEVAAAAMGVETRRHLLAQLEALRVQLRRVVCSEPWLRHCWETGDAYPPDVDTTPMCACCCDRCRATGRLWPAHYCKSVADGDPDRISYECYLESLPDEQIAYFPSSPSGLAMRAIRSGRRHFQRLNGRRRRQLVYQI